MTGRLFVWAVVALLGLLGGGCATVVTGNHQDIAVVSQPADADCTLMRDGATIATVRTPGTVNVKRDAKPITVVCRKDDHDDNSAVMTSQLESMTAGNLLIGGLVGVIVDAASGANSRYGPSVLVRLTPAVGGRPPTAAIVAAAGAAAPASADPAGPAAARPAAAATPFTSVAAMDGDYRGDIDLVQRTSGGYRINPRHIEARVRDGVGIGTVKHPRCDQPGRLEFRIDASGAVSGTANSVNTDGCVEHKAFLAGRAEGRDIQLTLTRERFPGWSTDFTLVRAP